MYSLSRLCQHGVKYVKVLNTKIGARYAVTLSLTTTRPIFRSIMSINAQTRYFIMMPNSIKATLFRPIPFK